MKVSELIRRECCSIGLLSFEKAEVVKKVELLEYQIIFLENQLNNALKKIQGNK